MDEGGHGAERLGDAQRQQAVVDGRVREGCEQTLQGGGLLVQEALWLLLKALPLGRSCRPGGEPGPAAHLPRISPGHLDRLCIAMQPTASRMAGLRIEPEAVVMALGEDSTTPRGDSGDHGDAFRPEDRPKRTCTWRGGNNESCFSKILGPLAAM